jgi:hypothetical protein
MLTRPGFEMQNIENWRIQELGMILEEIASILKQGENPEWAGVFDHFDSELRQINSAKTVDSRALQRLVRNISACFSSGSSFPALVLQSNQSRDRAGLDLRFARTKADLWRALKDLESRLTQYVH